MLVVDVLSRERVSVAGETEGHVRDKPAALRRLAQLLSTGADGLEPERVLGVLAERERLQSTGVGGGVAVPHGSLDVIDRQVGALLICPSPIPFDAIDGEPVAILFGLVGPRDAPADHLRVLACVSRLLRREAVREQLVQARHGADAYSLVASCERGNR
jgi:PTS system nitrogen regulatory IIA component